MDLARGMSLRKKRSVKPKISAPKQISAPLQTQKPGLPAISENGTARPRLPGPSSSSSSLNVARTRGQGQASTADYVKRRYSTRINLPTDFGDAPTLPSVPTEFLAQPPARAPGRSASAPGEKIAVDLKALQDPNLPAEQYVARLLANATESDIAAYQSDLTKIKNRTSTDLQHNVYQNRQQFIKISQEADRLKSEMRSLKNLMSDLTSTLGQTNAALGINTTETVSARKYANRSSVANLEAMWSTHLQELWRRVEGSQKYLPAIPGRHVVHESGRWVELNTATFKPRRRVHLILLNDHLLVAVEKGRSDNRSASPDPTATLNPNKKQQQGPTSYIAERCLPLQDVELTDLGMKRQSAMPGGSVRRASRQPNTNAVNVRIGQESFTYACTDQDGGEKAAFLAKFRKAVSDLRKTVLADTDDATGGLSVPGTTNRSKSRSPTGREKQNGLASPNLGTEPRGSMLIEVDGRQQSFRWLEQRVDDLDIDVALQRYRKAVQGIEDLRRIAARNKSNVAVQELVTSKVSARATKLARGILRDLTEKAAWAAATKENVALLQRLGFETQASASFLAARSEVVRTRVSQCADTGDLAAYLWQLAWITFTLLRNTVSVYQGAFSQGMGSAVVKWAKEHTEGFNRVLERQVGRLERGGQERRRVMEGVRGASGTLREVGVDFGGLVGRGLEE